MLYSKTHIDALMTRFLASELPKDEWTHHAHLMMGIYMLYQQKSDLLSTVRQLIKKHNESVGTPNSDSGGYHETITIFWLWIAEKFISENDFVDVYEACNAFINWDKTTTSLPLEYYSKELLFSVKARHEFVKPNLKELK